MKKVIISFSTAIVLMLLAASAVAADDSIIEKIKKGDIKLTKDWKFVDTNVKCRENNDLYQCEFIQPRDNQAKKPAGRICYKLLGGKWNTLPVSYVINPVNPQGLSYGFVASTLSASAETWDNATQKELFNNVYGSDNYVQYGVRDYKNAMVFGLYSGSTSTIAVTSIWFTRKAGIVEFDILFNTVYAWGDAEINPSLMDLQNIATHEIGHTVGLDDIYTSACSYVTMYGYSNYGDIAKRTLEQPDITGLLKMYP